MRMPSGSAMGGGQRIIWDGEGAGGGRAWRVGGRLGWCVTWDSEADDDNSKEGGCQSGGRVDLRREHQSEQVLRHVRKGEGAQNTHCRVEDRRGSRRSPELGTGAAAEESSGRVERAGRAGALAGS